MFYRNIGELYQCVDELLGDEDLRLKIAAAGYELSKKHTYTKRVEKLIQLYKVVS